MRSMHPTTVHSRQCDVSLSPAQLWAWHGHIAQIELSMEELPVLLPTTHDSWHKREAKHFAYNSELLLLRKL